MKVFSVKVTRHRTVVETALIHKIADTLEQAEKLWEKDVSHDDLAWRTIFSNTTQTEVMVLPPPKED